MKIIKGGMNVLILFILAIIVVGGIIIQSETEDMNRLVHNKIMNKGEELRREFRKQGELKYFAYFINHEYFAVVDNYLHVNIGTLKGKTNINNVMATEIKYHVSEKNRMRFMSVMPTYDKYTKLVNIELILYRHNKGDVNFILNPDDASEQQIKKLKMVLDEIINENITSNT